MGLVEPRPFAAVAQLLQRAVDRLALARPQTELDDLGQHGFIGGSQFVRVQHAKQMSDRLPAVLERPVDLFEFRNRAGPGGSQLAFDGVQPCRCLGEEMFDGGHDVIGTNRGEVGQAAGSQQRVVDERGVGHDGESLWFSDSDV